MMESKYGMLCINQRQKFTKKESNYILKYNYRLLR